MVKSKLILHGNLSQGEMALFINLGQLSMLSQVLDAEEMAIALGYSPELRILENCDGDEPVLQPVLLLYQGDISTAVFEHAERLRESFHCSVGTLGWRGLLGRTPTVTPYEPGDF